MKNQKAFTAYEIQGLCFFTKKNKEIKNNAWGRLVVENTFENVTSYYIFVNSIYYLNYAYIQLKKFFLMFFFILFIHINQLGF